MKNNFFKRKIFIFSFFILCIFSFSIINTSNANPKENEDTKKIQEVNVGILYNEFNNSGFYLDTLSHLEESLVLNTNTQLCKIENVNEISKYNVIFLDSSIVNFKDENFKKKIMDFVKNGGYLFLTNEFYNYFPLDFLGAKKFEKITSFPINLKYPNVNKEVEEVQNLIKDFIYLFKEVPENKEIIKKYVSYGLVPKEAVSLANLGELSLYSLNSYGKGKVFFANSILPNKDLISGFSMEKRSNNQKGFSNLTASANQIMENWFVSYYSKDKFGYSVNRVFGPYGNNAMAWELHFEDINGIKNKSAILFGELAKDYFQIPSYTLVRNSYPWLNRFESITYLLNTGNMEKPYVMDFYENAYSSGTHVSEGNLWLNQVNIPNSGSYFKEYTKYLNRAYPCLKDLNKDGILDIVSGSSNGSIYYYEGLGYNDRLEFKNKVELIKPSNYIQGYSAPELFDLDKDGILDIISGSKDGKLYWFKGSENLKFKFKGTVSNYKVNGFSMPRVFDLNGDGINDLIVGSTKGELLVIYGNTSGFLKSKVNKINLPKDLGTFIAPNENKFKNYGKNTLLIGTKSGYIGICQIDKSNNLKVLKYLTTDEMNFLGNYKIKFGENAVPILEDLNGDNRLDLIVGSLEYGPSYPIDCKNFPYKENLQENINYIKDNNQYIGLHFYTKKFASKEREAKELDFHKKAMKFYNIDLDNKPFGANRHTWNSSNLSFKQSFLSEYNNNVMWNSGFSPAFSTTPPQINPRNALSLPFILLDENKEKLLIQNCSTLFYRKYENISAKYGMPMLLYYHCENVYKDKEGALKHLKEAQDFREKYGYSFQREDQLMLSIFSAYNLEGLVERGEDEIVITPISGKNKNHGLYNEDYQYASGVKLSFRSDISLDNLEVNGDIYRKIGNDLFIGLNKPVSIKLNGKNNLNKKHIITLNLPSNISFNEDTVEINFKGEGLMEVSFNGKVETKSEGWNKVYKNGKTIFRKFGARDTLVVNLS